MYQVCENIKESVNTHRCFSSCAQLSLFAFKCKTYRVRVVEGFTFVQILHSIQCILNLIVESFSVQNTIKIHSTVFNSCFRDYFPCHGTVVSCSGAHEQQFSWENMKPTGTAFTKRQSGADYTDPCKQLCQIDITVSSMFCNWQIPESKDSNLFQNSGFTNF